MCSAPEPSEQACLAGGEDTVTFDPSRSYGEAEWGLAEQGCTGL